MKSIKNIYIILIIFIFSSCLICCCTDDNQTGFDSTGNTNRSITENHVYFNGKVTISCYFEEVRTRNGYFPCYLEGDITLKFFGPGNYSIYGTKFTFNSISIHIEKADCENPSIRTIHDRIDWKTPSISILFNNTVESHTFTFDFKY